MKCPKCGRMNERSRGAAININQRVDTGRVNGYGERIERVPLIKDVLVAECYCGYWECGYEVGGVFLVDDDLCPATAMLEAYLAYEQDRDDQRGPRPDPGE